MRRAAKVVEDLYQLGALLNASLEELHDWIAGRANPPVHVFLKAVDIIDAGSQGKRSPRGGE